MCACVCVSVCVRACVWGRTTRCIMLLSTCRYILLLLLLFLRLLFMRPPLPPPHPPPLPPPPDSTRHRQSNLSSGFGIPHPTAHPRNSHARLYHNCLRQLTRTTPCVNLFPRPHSVLLPPLLLSPPNPAHKWCPQSCAQLYLVKIPAACFFTFHHLVCSDSRLRGWQHVKRGWKEHGDCGGRGGWRRDTRRF